MIPSSVLPMIASSEDNSRRSPVPVISAVCLDFPRGESLIGSSSSRFMSSRFIDSVRGTELDWSRIIHTVASRAQSLAFLSRYGLAAILAGLAVLASLQLAPQSTPRYLLWPCYPAVMLSAWFGGFGPGLVTTLLSALVLTYIDRTIHSLMIQGPVDLMGFVLFLSVGVLLTALNAQLLVAQRRVEGVTRELRRESDERKTVEAVAAKLVAIVDELQTSVDRYRERMGSLAGVFRARRDGRIVECNDLFVRLLGASSPQRRTKRSLHSTMRPSATTSSYVSSAPPRPSRSWR